jgi:hypothetical protein
MPGLTVRKIQNMRDIEKVSRIKEIQRQRMLLSSSIEVGIEVTDTEESTISEDNLNINLQSFNETVVSVMNTTVTEFDAEIFEACGFASRVYDSSCALTPHD